MGTENIYCNTDKRLFLISDEIDNETMGKLCFNLLYLLQEDDKNEKEKVGFVREPIKFFINSYGGNRVDMWVLVDIMLNSKTPIYTYCTGYAMSAGLKIFLAGSKRFMSKHAVLFYHQMSYREYGKHQDIIENREERDNCQAELENYVCNRTNISKEKLDEIRLCKKDWYIHLDEAIELGIAEEYKG